MKKLLSVMLVLLALLSMLASCTNTTTTEPEEVPSSPSEIVTPSPTPSLAPATSPQATPTPVEPSPEPTPTPTPSEKEEGAPMTEEELGVLPVGQYTVTPVGTETPISYANEEKDYTVNVASGVGGALNELTIVYQTHKKDPYYLVFAGSDSMHVLATPDRFAANEGDEIIFRGKQYTSGKTTYFDDKRETLQWRIEENEDGSYTFVMNKNTALCLSLKDGKLVLEKRAEATGITSFNLNMVKRGGGDAFIQYISDEGNVVIRLNTDIKTRAKVTDEMLQTWANNLDDAYNHYIDLTSYVAYESIVVKAYEPSPHIGYVWNSTEHYNVITIEETFMARDLNKMAVRWRKSKVQDWNFCALHEMGHMFDNQQPWYFEAEMMTDLKVAYVLQASGGCAAPSEYGAGSFFYADGVEGHAQIEECYEGLAAGKKPIGQSLEYGAYGAAQKFVEIQRQIDDANWTVFKQAYAELYKEGRTTYKNYERFENFVAKLSKFSEKDVRALFTDEEWNVFMKKYGAPDAQ
ncbi:MAG: hypothetical protein IJ344_04885 [Clostridia bacterium]|nr:hypothetical protein [Clostridia bacterium]